MSLLQDGWSNFENIVVYTVLIGQNEGLNLQPQIKNSKLRHVCLTDNKNLKSNDWEIIYVESCCQWST